jgi:hypothetical protein
MEQQVDNKSIARMKLKPNNDRNQSLKRKPKSKNYPSIYNKNSKLSKHKKHKTLKIGAEMTKP